MNKARDNQKHDEIIFDEAKALVNARQDEEFPAKIMTYMMSLQEKR